MEKMYRGTKVALENSKLPIYSLVFATDLNTVYGGNTGFGVKTKTGVNWLEKENKYYQYGNGKDEYIEIISAPNYKEARKIAMRLNVSKLKNLKVNVIKDGSKFFYGEPQIPFAVNYGGYLKTLTPTGKVDFDWFVRELELLKIIDINWNDVYEIFRDFKKPIPKDLKQRTLFNIDLVLNRT